MLAKFLLIGTGGSGGKSLSVIRTSLERRLRYAGWDKGIPAGWQFLWVDTITSMSSLAPFKSLPNTDYLGLVPATFDYDKLLNGAISVAASAGSTVPIGNFGGWVPVNVPIDVGTGAGQSRGIGRAISASQLKVVRGRIDKALEVLNSSTTDTELFEVAQALNLNVERSGKPLTTQAILFGSSAGGTGSGIFMDIAECMMAASPALADKHRTILFAPDVFNSLAPAARKEVQPNGLGTISEVVSGTWAAEVSPQIKAYFSAAGATMGQPGFGPKRVYLMGSRNSAGVTMGNQDDVYMAAGEAIAAVITSLELQNDLLNQRETNAFDKSFGKQDTTRLKSDPTGVGVTTFRQPLSSIGFSRLSLGVDRLGEFTAESLGKAGVQRLLWPAYVPASADDPKTPTELVDEKVLRLFATEFLPKSGLNERDPSNDVIDALKPLETNARMATFAGNSLSYVGQQQGKHGLAPSQWVAGIIDFYNRNRDSGFVIDELNAVNERAREWSGQIESKIVDLVAEFCAREGLQVAHQLVVKLREEVEWVATNELRRDVEGFQRYLGDMPGAVSQALLSSGLSSLLSSNPLMQSALSKLQSGLQLQSDIIRYQTAIELLTDLCQNLLKPLENALVAAHIQLSDAVNDRQLLDGTKNPWPEVALLRDDNKTVVPARYQPAATELLLIEPATYPKVIEEQIKSSISESQGIGWLDHATVRAILGQELADPIRSSQSFIKPVSHWITEKRETRSSSSANASVGKYEISSNPWTIIEKIGGWILDPTTAFGKFLRGDLVKYIDHPDAATEAERTKDFLQKFQMMVAKSAPLADVNLPLASIVHGNTGIERGLEISKVPFDPSDPIGEKLIQMLYGIHYQASAFQAGSVVTEITAFEVLDAMSPVVFDSVMKGIATDWNMQKGDNESRLSFWNWRRTLPLTQAIPASRAVIESMVQGWFVAFLLGQVKVDLSDVNQFGPRVEVWDPQVNSYAPMPYPFLGTMDSKKDFELIAQVLSSLPLALVDVNSQVSLNPLRAYWRLIDLGSTVQSSGAAVSGGLQLTESITAMGATESNTPLGKWVSSGAVDSGTPAPNPAIAGEGTSDARRQALLTSVESFQQYFKSSVDQIDLVQTPFSPEIAIPASYELKDLISSALKSVAAQIKSA